MIVHSDAFQARYQQRCREVGKEAVHTMSNAITGLAALAVEKATEKLTDGTASERFLGETMKNTLSALGYTNGNNGNGHTELHQHQHIHVDAIALREAREEALAAKAGTTEVKVIELTARSA